MAMNMRGTAVPLNGGDDPPLDGEHGGGAPALLSSSNWGLMLKGLTPGAVKPPVAAEPPVKRPRGRPRKPRPDMLSEPIHHVVSPDAMEVLVKLRRLLATALAQQAQAGATHDTAAADAGKAGTAPTTPEPFPQPSPEPTPEPTPEPLRPRWPWASAPTARVPPPVEAVAESGMADDALPYIEPALLPPDAPVQLLRCRDCGNMFPHLQLGPPHLEVHALEQEFLDTVLGRPRVAAVTAKAAGAAAGGVADAASPGPFDSDDARDGPGFAVLVTESRQQLWLWPIGAREVPRRREEAVRLAARANAALGRSDLRCTMAVREHRVSDCADDDPDAPLVFFLAPVRHRYACVFCAVGECSPREVIPLSKFERAGGELRLLDLPVRRPR